ncbi:MAG: OsmC family protein [Thermoplasmata archaeon]
MTKLHQYRATVAWTGNLGSGTRQHAGYRRDHIVTFPGKAPLPGSSHPEYRGDPTRYNPEELLVAALSACHMLWFLHLCADAGLEVEEYTDDAEGVMETDADGSGRFILVTLHPRVTARAGPIQRAAELHEKARAMCFIANSVNFPVRHEATIAAAPIAPSASPALGPGASP